MSKRDFDLLIEADGNNWKAKVISSPAGEISNKFKLSFSAEKWQTFFGQVARSAYRERLKTKNDVVDFAELEEKIKVFGSELFEAVFDTKNVGRVFRRSIEIAKKEDFDLCLRLRLDDPKLNELPWEYLYDPDEEKFIVLSEQLPILRYLEIAEPVESLEITPPLQVLVVVANPSAKRYAHLDVEKEWQNLQDAVKELVEKDLLTLTRLESPTFSALTKELALGKTKYHVFHFIGHGGFYKKSGQGTLIFEDSAKRSRAVSSDKLSTVLDDHDSLRLAFLNACEGAHTGGDPFAGVAQALVRRGVPAVVAMQFKITDKSAITLAKSFYQGLALNKSVDKALTIARKLVYTAEKSNFEWGTPVLFMRSSEGYLFNVGEFEGRIRDIPDNPYKGLEAFREEDKDNFFGRQRFIEQLSEVVTEKPLVALVGNSGSGKSSVVFAGLVPKLREEDWFIASFRPQEEPFKKLANALVEHLETNIDNKLDKLLQAKRYAKSFRENKLKVFEVIEDFLSEHNKPLLLIIDQFEELFTLTLDKDLQYNFLRHIVEATQKGLQRFTLLVAMRSDFVSDALDHTELGQVLSQAMLTLTAMNRKEMYEAIEEPAEKQGVSLEAGLTETILGDVFTGTDEKDVSGRLPLVEFALTLLWEKQEKSILTHEAYQAIGKVEGALAGYAEEVFSKYLPEEQEKLKHIFTQLVRPGEGTEDTRQVSTKERIGEQNWDLVTRLASERLVTTYLAEDTEEETAEFIHEALIRSWSRLRGWVDTYRDFRIWQNRLRPMVKEWQKINLVSLDSSLLLRGRQLLLAEEYLKSHEEQLEKAAQNFIRASTIYEQEEVNKKRRQQRRIMFGVTAFAIIAVVLASLAIWFAINSNQAEKKAKRQADIILMRQLITQAKLSMQSANFVDNYAEITALLSIQGMQLKKGFESVSHLFSTLQNLPHLNTTLHGHKGPVNSVAFSPDGSQVVSGSSDKTVRLWDVKTGEAIGEPWQGHSDAVSSLAFSPDGTKVLSGSKDITVRLWDVEVSNAIGEPWQGHSSVIESIAFSPNGLQGISGSGDNNIHLWDVKTGETIGKPWQGHSDVVNSLAFSPDGFQVISSSNDGSVRLWDVKTGEAIGEPWQGHGNPVNSVAFSPDGSQVVSGSSDGSVRLWDAKTGESIGEPWQRHNDVVNSIAFSPDGSQIVSGSNDNSVCLWDAKTGEVIGESWQGHSDAVNSVAFSPDGSQVVSGSNDGSVRLWDVKTGKVIGEPWQGHNSDIWSVAFSPDGSQVVSGSSDETVRLWDAETREAIGAPWQGHSGYVWSAVFSPDSTQVVSGGSDKTVRLWDTETGQSKTFDDSFQHRSYVHSVAFSPDGSKVVSGSRDGTLRLWDAKKREVVERFHPGYSDVNSVAFSPDGSKVVFGSSDNIVRLWEWDAKISEVIGKPWQERSDYVFNVDFSSEVAFDLDLDRPRARDAKIAKLWQGHSDAVWSVAFSPDGTQVVSGSSDKTVRLWDVKTGETIGKPWQGHSDIVNSVAFSPDSTQVVSGSSDKTVRLWDVKTGETLGEPWQGHGDDVWSVAFSPDSTKVVSGSRDKTLRFWDVKTGKAIGNPLQGHSANILSVTFSPDGSKVISGSIDNIIRLWDVKTGEAIGEPWQDYHSNFAVLSLAFSPDGTQVVSGSWNKEDIWDKEDIKGNTMRLWDVKTGKAIGEPWQGHSSSVNSVAFSPDGTQVVSGSRDRTVRLWDVKTGKTIGEPWQGHSDIVNSVAFSPDGTQVVSGSRDRTVRLWDAKTGKTIDEPWQEHSFSVNSVAFSPDGTQVVSGSSDKTVRLWDVKTGKVIGVPWQEHNDAILSVAFSPDGTKVVSGSGSRSIAFSRRSSYKSSNISANLMLWDVKTGRLIGESWQRDSASILSVAFSPDGKKIVSGSAYDPDNRWDNMIVIWDVDEESWKERLCRIAGRNFTKEEWGKYIGDRPYKKTCSQYPAGN